MTRYTDVKDAFAEWAEQGADLDQEFLETRGREIELGQAMNSLRDSEDIMPDTACDGLSIPASSTFSEGAHAAMAKAKDELVEALAQMIVVTELPPTEHERWAAEAISIEEAAERIAEQLGLITLDE